MGDVKKGINRVVLGGALFAALVSCGPSPADHPAGATPYTSDEKARIARGLGRIEDQTAASAIDYDSIEFAERCADGLSLAAKRALVSTDRSSLVVPWSIERTGGSITQPILGCAVLDGGNLKFVNLEIVCADSAKARCTRLVSVTDSRRPQ